MILISVDIHISISELYTDIILPEQSYESAHADQMLQLKHE